jgi:NAD+ kinase
LLSLGKCGADLYIEPPTDAELIVVVGGDGSIIDASRLAISMNIPMLGINLGRVGYLSEVEPDALDVLERLAAGDYNIEQKMLLTVDKYSPNGSHESSARDAVNDVVISHDVYFGIAEFKLENSYGDRMIYRADGLILSTPAGSTAYSLSAGGPVIAHNLDSITVTPVCPHTFFNRSIVYGKDECIKISNSGDQVLNISVDGRFFAGLDTGEWCVVKRSSKKLRMVTFSENNMFAALLKKIKAIDA